MPRNIYRRRSRIAWIGRPVRRTHKHRATRRRHPSIRVHTSRQHIRQRIDLRLRHHPIASRSRSQRDTRVDGHQVTHTRECIRNPRQRQRTSRRSNVRCVCSIRSQRIRRGHGRHFIDPDIRHRCCKIAVTAAGSHRCHQPRRVIISRPTIPTQHVNIQLRRARTRIVPGDRKASIFIRRYVRPKAIGMPCSRRIQQRNRSPAVSGGTRRHQVDMCPYDRLLTSVRPTLVRQHFHGARITRDHRKHIRATTQQHRARKHCKNSK